MSDALALLPDSNAEGYSEIAHELRRACESGAILEWAIGFLGAPTDREALRVERAWREFQKRNESAGRCDLADSQLFLARVHGFSDWPIFTAHLRELSRETSEVSRFEHAVEAVINGEIANLERVLRDYPELVQARSMRTHGSTLLHYVSANGVEDFRQKTPRNIVAITKMLLDAGADVNAESGAYGGHSTTLALAATSCHPANAGVQVPLMELLIEHGATMDGAGPGGIVNACLHNGRGPAAEFLANRGAPVDLEGACGIGRLDRIESFFKEDGSLGPGATEKQLIDGFTWACEFGRLNVVRFLLDEGMTADARLSRGETGLHWAAFEAHTEIARLLLEHGARCDVRDASHGGTPLDWALYGWRNRTDGKEFYEVVAVLCGAGAKLDLEWFDDDEERKPVRDRVRSDPRMLAALGTQVI